MDNWIINWIYWLYSNWLITFLSFNDNKEFNSQHLHELNTYLFLRFFLVIP